MVQAARQALPYGRKKDQLIRAVSEKAFLPTKSLLEEVGNMVILTGKTVVAAVRPPYPYGAEFVGTYLKAEAGDRTALESILARFAIAWTILRPESPANTTLDALGWRVLYRDNAAVVHVREAVAFLRHGTRNGRYVLQSWSARPREAVPLVIDIRPA